MNLPETSRSSEKEAFEKSGDLNSTFTILVLGKVEPAAAIKNAKPKWLAARVSNLEFPTG